jgi:hypothetical protein
MIANSTSPIIPSRHRVLSSGSLLIKGSFAESNHAVLGASDCEGLPPQNREKQESSEQDSQKNKMILIKDTVQLSALSTEALRKVTTKTETAILEPSSILKQACRMLTPLESNAVELDNSLAQSNWSVYSAKLLL